MYTLIVVVSPATLSILSSLGTLKGPFQVLMKIKKGNSIKADGGTLFLDEIGELSLDLQSKLLTVLESEDSAKPLQLKIHAVGSRSETSKLELNRTVSVRVIFATNRDLAEMVDNGTFRMDLYYRIATLCIPVPSLNERVDDIPALSKHLLELQNKAMAEIFPAKTLTARAINALCDQEWSGNIRQLNSVIIRAYINTDLREEIDDADVIHSLGQDPLANRTTGSVYGKPLPLEEGQLEQLENKAKAEVSYHYWKRALDESEKPGKTQKAADKLAFEGSENTIVKKIKKACIDAGKPLLVGRDA